MIDSQQMQDGRMQIMDMHRVFSDVVTVFVGLSITYSGLNATSGHPHGETTRMMIASEIIT